MLFHFVGFYFADVLFLCVKWYVADILFHFVISCLLTCCSPAWNGMLLTYCFTSWVPVLLTCSSSAWNGMLLTCCFTSWVPVLLTFCFTSWIPGLLLLSLTPLVVSFPVPLPELLSLYVLLYVSFFVRNEV
jgi:hypothetical protein